MISALPSAISGVLDVQWRATLDAGPGGQIGHAGERLDEFRTAIRITRIIDRIDADENIAGIEHFGESQCIGQEIWCCGPEHR